MTAKEKAEALFDKYFSQIRMPSDCEGCMQCVNRCESMVYVAKKYSVEAVQFAKGCIKWNAYPLDAEWAELSEIEKEIYKL